ncbi:hypothetical protein DY000_02004712 [Brassica cretica]|uniref:Uncharacterized protein n=1 Tax=Brassica cretica TaxID=69181 RepID=A0ABQ7BS76_BRACR|nr:hypothetical protein DY000_02004712 [Brassica cretica]
MHEAWGLGKASLVLKAWVWRSEVQAHSVLLSGHLSDLDQFEDCGSGSVGSLPAVRLFEGSLLPFSLFAFMDRGSSPSHRVFYYKMLETDVLCSVSPLEAVMRFQASYGGNLTRFSSESRIILGRCGREYNTSSSSTSNHYLRLSVRLSAMELMQFLSPGVIPFLSPEDNLVKKCHCHRSRPLCMLVCFK